MAGDLEELRAFARANASDPVALAKIITAWEFAALGPGNPTPMSVEEVVTSLEGQCGWRDLLMRDLFDEIGIEGRRIGLFDVPFQGSHAATELFINGEWMFFDPTFGTYFETPDGGGPLSYAEARSMWPDVVVQHVDMPGWQHRFIDPSTINSDGFSPYESTLFCVPEGYFGRPDFVNGEVTSLYFGEDVRYDSITPIESEGNFWRNYVDEGNQAEWARWKARFDVDGSLDTRFGYYDDSPAWCTAWFTDWDQRDSFEWSEKTAILTPRTLLDLQVTIFDDGSKVIEDNDQGREYNWSSQSTYFNASGRLTHQTGTYDDGGSWRTMWNEDGSSYRDEFNAEGGFLSRDNGPQTFATPDALARLERQALPEDPLEMIRVTDNPNGTQSITQFDVFEQYSFESVTAVLTGSGQRASVDYSQDNGSRVFYGWDLEDQLAYEEVIWSFDQAGNRTAVGYKQDNGESVYYQYDVHDWQLYEEVMTVYSGAGARKSVHYSNDDRSTAVYQWDVDDLFLFDQVDTTFDADGSLTRVGYKNDDRSMDIYQYDVGDNYLWSSMESQFSSGGHREAIVYNQDDGSHVVYAYRPDGTLLSVQTYADDWLLVA